METGKLCFWTLQKQSWCLIEVSHQFAKPSLASRFLREMAQMAQRFAQTPRSQDVGYASCKLDKSSKVPQAADGKVTMCVCVCVCVQVFVCVCFREGCKHPDLVQHYSQGQGGGA